MRSREQINDKEMYLGSRKKMLAQKYTPAIKSENTGFNMKTGSFKIAGSTLQL